MTEYQVFVCVSNSKSDRAFVKVLLRDLERLNVKGRSDRPDEDAEKYAETTEATEVDKNADAGAEWTEQITTAITQADALVVVMSEVAMKSNWVMAEIGQGISVDKPLILVVAPKSHPQFAVPSFLKGTRAVVDARTMKTLEVTAAVASAVKRTDQQTELNKLLREQLIARIAMFALAGGSLLLTVILVLKTWLGSYLSRWFH